MADTQVILTSGTSYTVPDDWSDTSNTIEAIGGGGSGGSNSRAGGGGGGYSKITNLSLTAGASINFIHTLLYGTLIVTKQGGGVLCR